MDIIAGGGFSLGGGGGGPTLINQETTLGFRVEGLGRPRVEGLGFRVYRVSGPGVEQASLSTACCTRAARACHALNPKKTSANHRPFLLSHLH